MSVLRALTRPMCLDPAYGQNPKNLRGVMPHQMYDLNEATFVFGMMLVGRDVVMRCRVLWCVLYACAICTAETASTPSPESFKLRS